MNLAVFDHPNQISPIFTAQFSCGFLLASFPMYTFFPFFVYVIDYYLCAILPVAFLGMYTWVCRLWVSTINHDWSVISTGGVNMFISLTFHRSILAPVFQSSYKIADAYVGLKNVYAVRVRWIHRRWRRSGCSDVLVLPIIYTFSMIHPPGRVRALPQLGFFDTVNYSLHLVPVAVCLIPPVCL